MGNIEPPKNGHDILKLRDVIYFFENHPASFLIAGIFCFLIAAHALKLQVGSTEIILISPTNKILQSILLFFGITLIFVGIYLIFLKWNVKSLLLRIVLIIFFSVSSFFSFYTIFSVEVEPPFPLEGYGYRLNDSSFYVTLSCPKIAEHKGTHLISVIRRSNPSISKELDPDIDISNPFPLQKNMEGCITIKTEAKRIKDEIKLGDKIECYIFAIPPIVDISRIRKIEDIANIGGRLVWVCASLVAIVENTPEELAACYQKLDENSKDIFKEKVGIR